VKFEPFFFGFYVLDTAHVVEKMTEKSSVLRSETLGM